MKHRKALGATLCLGWSAIVFGIVGKLRRQKQRPDLPTGCSTPLINLTHQKGG